MKKAKEIPFIFLILLYIIFIIKFSKETATYILNAINNCINLIIPSLYIFLIISDFVITSNIYTLLSKPFSLISRYVFKIPEHFFSIYMISNIGGYPIGAKLISDMINEDKIDFKTAEDMMNYCYFSGPAFIIGIVGTNIYSDFKIGIIIFVSIFMSNFIIAALIGLSRDIPESHTPEPELNIEFDNFIKSIYSGGKSICKICAIIIFFSSIICIMDNCNIISTIAGLIDRYTQLDYSDSVAVIKSFVEISNITLFKPHSKTVPLITSLLSFGGLCILLQIKSINSKISLRYFFIIRVIAMLLSYFICKLLYLTTYDFLSVTFSPVYIPHSQNSPIITIFLLIMTILFLLKISMEKIKKL